jgi:hypothetical protein
MQSGDKRSHNYIDMVKFIISKTGQENGDLLIQVTAWVGLTVYALFINRNNETARSFHL